MVRRAPHLVLLIAVAVLTFLVSVVTAAAAPFALSMQDPRPYAHAEGEQAARFDQMSGLGADVTRLTLRWNEVAARCTAQMSAEQLADQNARCYDWATTDRAVRLAQARGMSVLVSLYGTPQWVVGSNDPAYTGGSHAEFESFVAKYAAFAQVAAARYAPGSAHGTVARWTIWNEPNGELFWRPQGSDAAVRYADTYAAAAASIKAAAPGVLVAPGPTAPNSRPVRPGVYIPVVQSRLEQLGATHLVDAWAHNPYPGGNVSPYKIVWKLPSIGIGNIEDLVDILDASSVTRGKPIWGTEFAYQTNPPDTKLGTSPALQAQWMAEALDVAWTTTRMPIFGWYVMHDTGGDPHADWDSGLFDVHGAEKPAAAMFRRPIAVRKLPDGTARVWGVSGVDPTHGQLVARSSPAAEWRMLAFTMDENGVMIAQGRYANGAEVAVRDSLGIGPTRDIASAWVETDATRVLAGRGTGVRKSAAKPVLVLRQARSTRSTASACGKTVAQRCRYRARGARTAAKPSVPALRVGLKARGRVTGSMQWQMWRAGRWRPFTRVKQKTIVTRAAKVLQLPAAVRIRPGLYRVRIAPTKRNAATSSTWQFLHVRR